MKRLLAGLLLACTLAHAEKLELVGAIEPAGIKVYVDRESIKTRGNFASVGVVVPIGVNYADKMPFEVNCDTLIGNVGDHILPSTTPMNWEKDGKQMSISSKTLTNIYHLACKKSYEFWK